MLEDAEIDTLIFDPAFAERAQELQERVPTLDTAAVLRAAATSATTSCAGEAVRAPAARSRPM